MRPLIKSRLRVDSCWEHLLYFSPSLNYQVVTAFNDSAHIIRQTILSEALSPSSYLSGPGNSIYFLSSPCSYSPIFNFIILHLVETQVHVQP